MRKTRYIFVVGGVMSGLGKGVTTASIGMLLKSRGFQVSALKIDPYINLDAGTMRPAEHGEVFVTDDGGEIDQDIGTYERFLNTTLTREHNITTGKVFKTVIEHERSFVYGGRDVEMFPDVIDAISSRIRSVGKYADFVLVEIGGTTGDIENLPFLHAAREMAKFSPSLYGIVVYLPFLRNVGELKTKPAQHAVARLREIGIIPDFVITRNEVPIDAPRLETLARRCFVPREAIFDNPDVKDVYEVPIKLERQGITDFILKSFNVKAKTHDLREWQVLLRRLKHARKSIKVAIVGKYFQHGHEKHRDVYVSVLEAIKHASIFHSLRVNIVPIDSELLERKGDSVIEAVKPDGVIVPQGWGARGTEGKILAAQFCRENGVPFLGLCFGMQMAVIELARHKCGLARASSTEVAPHTRYPVVHIMPDQAKYLARRQYGGTIRLGAWPCVVERGTILEDVYKRFSPNSKFPSFAKASEGRKIQNSKFVVYERHRHRYEVNQKYVPRLKKAGLVISGTSPDRKLVEAIELKRSLHPFFVGTQFHPEYKSRPLVPHPIFLGFIEACAKTKKPRSGIRQ